MIKKQNASIVSLDRSCCIFRSVLTTTTFLRALTFYPTRSTLQY